MDLKNFYNQISQSEGYNLSNRLNLARPKGIKKIFSFDDRFLVVSDNLQKIISQNYPGKKLKLIDIGCGDGVYESLLTKEARKKIVSYGVDISVNQLKKAKKYIDKTLELDFENKSLPYKNNFFDIAICSEVLEHLFEPENILSEIARILKENGILILTAPNLGALNIRLGILLNSFSPMINYSQNKDHIRFFNKNDILKLTERKFKLITWQGLSSLYFKNFNSSINLPTPRFAQVFVDKIFKTWGSGLFFVFVKK